MDSSFNKPQDGGAPVSTPTPEGESKAAAPAAPASPAEERFQACRWRKAAENGTPEHCTHRDVLPMAGTAGFTPDSWCGDCSYFKAKRSPRKRPEPQQNDNWRW